MIDGETDPTKVPIPELALCSLFLDGDDNFIDTVALAVSVKFNTLRIKRYKIINFWLKCCNFYT